MQSPYLNWAGKAERTSFEVDTVSLHVHERIDAMSILAAVRKRMNCEKAGKINEGTQPSLFNASFVDKRDVKDRKDEDLTQDPEMVKAFRDTWDAITVAKSHTRPGT